MRCSLRSEIMAQTADGVQYMSVYLCVRENVCEEKERRTLLSPLPPPSPPHHHHYHYHHHLHRLQRTPVTFVVSLVMQTDDIPYSNHVKDPKYSTFCE
ncbi:hypothetical protein M0804_015286 [Polistes exclamans]|nr:hypothetical protein M0804_015288 [Polistes exclamans]KAI4473564.1 hypothetical protein M0804_015286 [Polistes exclamans]